MEPGITHPHALIFDVYGTLLETFPPPADADARWSQLCQELLHCAPSMSRLQFSIACNQAITRRHDTAQEQGITWPEILWPSIVAEVLPAFRQLPPGSQEEFIYRHIHTGHSVRLAGMVVETLRLAQAKGCLLGIASNAQAYTVRELREALAPHGLNLDIFTPDLCFWSYQHGFSKPDPHVFQLLSIRLEARGIRRREALMVGDRRDNDYEPALEAGWQAWHLGPEGKATWAGLHARLQSAPSTGL